MSGIKMANVRRSSDTFASVFGKRSIKPLRAERKTKRPTTQVEIIEMEPKVQVQRNAAGEIEQPRTLRRHSTGSVNSANLRASIRRLQQRRFRTKPFAAAKCLEYFLTLLYYIGMSPLKPSSAHQLPKGCRRLQMILYWTLTFISILDAIAQVKSGWIEFRVKENMLRFVTFGYYLANFLARIYYIKVFATSSKTTLNLLEKMERVNCETFTRDTHRAYSVTMLISFLSISLAIVDTVFGEINLSDWTMEKAARFRSFDLSQSLFVWSSNDWENATFQLYHEYGEELTRTSGLLAVVGNVLNYCGTLHACVLMDMWPILTIQIYLLQLQFAKTIEETRHNGEHCPLSTHWQYYMRLRDVCDHTDAVFGKLLKIIHMQNMLLFGYFLLEILKKEPLNVPLLVDMIAVMKVSFTYYLAQKTASKNEQYEACIINCSKRRPLIEMNGIKVGVAMLLADMKKHPIGVGRGEYFVDEAFVLKFAGAVGSIFVLLSGETGETCQNGN